MNIANDSLHQFLIARKGTAMMMMKLTSNQLSALVELVENGPLYDAEVTNLPARDDLIVNGMATRIIVKAEEGWTAATYKGRDAYEAYFHGETLKEALAGREAMSVISAASKP
jgi:hypothetical protein